MDELAKIKKEAKTWTCKTRHRLNLGRDVRKSKEFCNLCAEMTSYCSFPANSACAATFAPGSRYTSTT
eukprot:15470519-Alexandrium_andersonii.AAC.1